MKQYIETDAAEVAQKLGDRAKGFSGKRVLMTGAHGFLGRNYRRVFQYLNEHVLDEPCHFVGFDNFIASNPDLEIDADARYVHFEQRDVIQPLSWDQPIDFVIHAAGIASPFYYRAKPLETLDVAVIGTRNALELAREHRARFTFFSSSEIYGDPDKNHVPTPESYRGNVACRGPRACYDESKRVGETLAYLYHLQYGVPTTTIRPFNVYGPGMQERDYRVLPNFASRIKGDRPLKVYGDGRQTRTYCYLTDALAGFLLTSLIGVPGEVYNIGNNKPEVSVLDLAKILETVLDRPLPIEVIEYPDSYPADEPQRRCPDIRKARTHLGYDPTIDLEEGLRRFIGWTQEAYTGENE